MKTRPTALNNVAEWFKVVSVPWVWEDFLVKVIDVGSLLRVKTSKDPKLYRSVHVPAILRCLGYSTGVEVGVQNGLLSYGLALALKGPIYLVDPWVVMPKSIYDDAANVAQTEQDAIYEKVVALFAGVDRVKIMRKTSMEANAILGAEGKQFDFVYIDANHWYPFVIQDLFAWWQLIRKGGVLCGHDFIAHAGVSEAVVCFLKANDIPVCYTTQGTDFFIVKESETEFFPSAAGRVSPSINPKHGKMAELLYAANQKRERFINSLPPKQAAAIRARDKEKDDFVKSHYKQP